MPLPDAIAALICSTSLPSGTPTSALTEMVPNRRWFSLAMLVGPSADPARLLPATFEVVP